MDSKRILEALQVQPLSEEEKASRHILCRLCGPIATCKESTRNGRRYNKDLWTKALSDEVFKEKIETKSLFLELGHPADREETDMTKACACIPELPRIINEDLYAVVDVLDTVNGRTLKKLIDYGFQPGISSRGSGDVMDNNEVDPETFYLETWDIVALPAVKKARLAVCESLDTEALQLRKALKESYDSESDEDKERMKEALDNLDIKLDDPIGEEAEPEEAENEETVLTVADIIDDFKEFDEDAIVEFEPIEIDGVKYAADCKIRSQEDGKITLGYDCTPIEGNDNIEDEQEAEDAPNDESVPEAEEAEEEANDDGDDEVIESLKESIRQKDALEEKVKALQKQIADSDAVVEELNESMTRYRDAFIRVSQTASKANKFAHEVESLKEQLTQRDTKIEELTGRAASAAKLTESIDGNVAKVKSLNESLAKANEENEALNEQLAQYKKKLAERTNLAKSYKNQFSAVLTRYVESKASMLGVTPSEITRRLNENYTIDDVDSVCEELLTRNVTARRLPSFGIDKSAKVKVRESVTKAKPADTTGGYEIDDDLLWLAGLDKTFK